MPGTRAACVFGRLAALAALDFEGLEQRPETASNILQGALYFLAKGAGYIATAFIIKRSCKQVSSSCSVCKHNCCSQNGPGAHAANRSAWWSRERHAKEMLVFSRRWRFPEAEISSAPTSMRPNASKSIHRILTRLLPCREMSRIRLRTIFALGNGGSANAKGHFCTWIVDCLRVDRCHQGHLPNACGSHARREDLGFEDRRVEDAEANPQSQAGLWMPWVFGWGGEGVAKWASTKQLPKIHTGVRRKVGLLNVGEFDQEPWFCRPV